MGPTKDSMKRVSRMTPDYQETYYLSEKEMTK